MASAPPSRSKNSLAETLQYFAKYDYPLTAEELWFWQHGTNFPKSRIKKFIEHWTLNFEHSKARKQHELISKKKWIIAKKVGGLLSKIPFIEAIFVTGSLAMSNCAPYADIDLMIITSPTSLWLPRLWVYLLIHSSRRRPQVTSAPDRVCDNLYLAANSLHLKEPQAATTNDLYVAHEILQAKCIFDRGGTHRQFLLSNSWVKTYLPIAYSETLKNLKFNNLDLISNFKFQISNLLLPINLLLFWLQYLYMKPKMTTERVALGFAFFHPNSASSK